MVDDCLRKHIPFQIGCTCVCIDSFLVEGWKVVYRVMLSLLDHASKDHTDKTFEDILNYFRDFPSTVNGQTIMAGSLRTH